MTASAKTSVMFAASLTASRSASSCAAKAPSTPTAASTARRPSASRSSDPARADRRGVGASIRRGDPSATVTQGAAVAPTGWDPVGATLAGASGSLSHRSRVPTRRGRRRSRARSSRRCPGSAVVRRPDAPSRCRHRSRRCRPGAARPPCDVPVIAGLGALVAAACPRRDRRPRLDARRRGGRADRRRPRATVSPKASRRSRSERDDLTRGGHAHRQILRERGVAPQADHRGDRRGHDGCAEEKSSLHDGSFVDCDLSRDSRGQESAVVAVWITACAASLEPAPLHDGRSTPARSQDSR